MSANKLIISFIDLRWFAVMIRSLFQGQKNKEFSAKFLSDATRCSSLKNEQHLATLQRIRIKELLVLTRTNKIKIRTGIPWNSDSLH